MLQPSGKGLPCFALGCHCVGRERMERKRCRRLPNSMFVPDDVAKLVTRITCTLYSQLPPRRDATTTLGTPAPDTPIP